MLRRPFDVITRGVDSSGRIIKQTRQAFQFYDRVNAEAANGLLVIIQGGWSDAEASANTHRLAMCTDYREWNLSTLVKGRVVRRGRDLMGTMWLRTEGDGFDPHFHNNLIGDAPADAGAIAQVDMYKLGLNGLANRQRDRNPYRPDKITNYKYIPEDDMFEKEDRDLLKKAVRLLESEKKRDAAERERDKERFARVVTVLGNQADELTLLINKTSDAATKNELKKMQEKILLRLKNDPDITEQDNPSDDALADRNMG